ETCVDMPFDRSVGLGLAGLVGTRLPPGLGLPPPRFLLPEPLDRRLVLVLGHEPGLDEEVDAVFGSHPLEGLPGTEHLDRHRDILLEVVEWFHEISPDSASPATYRVYRPSCGRTIGCGRSGRSR